MKSKLLVIGEANLVGGFQLVGVEDTVLVDENEFQAKFEQALAKPEYGIIVVNEKMLKKIDWKLKKKLDSMAYPVIIPLPAPGEKSEAGDEIRGLIKRALGFDLAVSK